MNGNGRAGATRASYLGLGHKGHDDDLGDEDAWSSDDDEERRTGSTLRGSGAGADKSDNPAVLTAGSRGGGREGFVPPILMQERRYGSGGRGR